MTDTSRKDWLDMAMEMVPKGAWRTPSLRDVALTAPYMHNGVAAHAGRGARALQPGRVVAAPPAAGRPQIKPLLPHARGEAPIWSSS